MTARLIYISFRNSVDLKKVMTYNLYRSSLQEGKLNDNYNFLNLAEHNVTSKGMNNYLSKRNFTHFVVLFHFSSFYTSCSTCSCFPRLLPQPPPSVFLLVPYFFLSSLSSSFIYTFSSSSSSFHPPPIQFSNAQINPPS